MPSRRAAPQARDDDRIDITHDYAVCAWARYFNTTERRIKEAVQAVGDRAGQVRDHLTSGPRERPSGA
jgi:hypothetical protein